jgi:type II secretory pathway pseudopilin PulG
MKEAVKTKKILILSIISAIIVFSLSGFSFWQIKKQNESIALLASEAQQSTAKDEAVRSIRLLFDKNKESLTSLDSFFISKDGVVDFINSIDLLGKKFRVDLAIGEVTSEIDQKIKDDFKETIKLRLDASGSWGDVIDFLTALENLPYKIKVDQVSVGLSSASDKLLFTNASSTSIEIRKPGDKEEWKATYTISILKLR